MDPSWISIGYTDSDQSASRTSSAVRTNSATSKSRDRRVNVQSEQTSSGIVNIFDVLTDENDEPTT